MLRGRNILLGVTGSIAAYKSAHLVRLLIKAGAQVRVVLTPSAKDFVTPLTLSTLSGNPVLSTFVEEGQEESGVWNHHVELGLWADLMLIAPASANTLAKMATGLCDNFLMAVFLSAKCPVYFAPAMDLDMYQHDTTKANLQRLQAQGNILIPAGTGFLASGLHGEGRMAEPEEIIAHLEAHLRAQQPLAGKTVLVTAGPTHEPIDPVRYIGNRASGKMGLALAREAEKRGARVVLIAGPIAESLDVSGLEVVRVTTALEMHAACIMHFPEAHFTWMAAAVADYRPSQPAVEKIKKSEERLEVILERNPDILSDLGQRKQAHQILVGFALETQQLEANALGKLQRKHLDFIVGNEPHQRGTGFGFDTNQVILLSRQGKKWASGLLNKDEIAQQLWDQVLGQLAAD
jgi:phosphopantothenoylcysteine decarboxylase/phosphopantothenate--cysteine ligase